MDKKYLHSSFNITELKTIRRDGLELGIIKGYASTFDNVDRGDDRVMKGAFDKTIIDWQNKGRQIPMFFQHDYKSVIGGFAIVRSDVKGLYCEGEINLGVEDGNDAYLLAKQGVLLDFSIGYAARGYEWIKENNKDIRNLTEVELFEISMVTNPMNELANITDVKSINNITEISKILKAKGFSNSEANDIIFKIKELQGVRKEDLEVEVRNELDQKLNEMLFDMELDKIQNSLKRR